MKLTEIVRTRMRKIRKDSQLSQGEVAMIMNIHENTYNRIERGARHVDLQDVESFCKALGVEPVDLMKGADL